GCTLVSHSPPRGAVDRSSNGRSLGSVAVREAVLRQQPALVVCGHIHASAGTRDMIGPTPVVNAGPDGILWELAPAGQPVLSGCLAGPPPHTVPGPTGSRNRRA